MMIECNENIATLHNVDKPLLQSLNYILLTTIDSLMWRTILPWTQKIVLFPNTIN